jgi:hypothetical protein
MNQEFSVTARVWKDVPLEKGVFIHSITDLLNENLSLSSYGDGIAEFNFTAVIEPDAFFPDKFRFLKSKKRVDAELRMDYEQAMAASMDAFKGQAVKLYLEAIEKIEAKAVQGFDTPQFKQDVESLFESQGWLMYV